MSTMHNAWWTRWQAKALSRLLLSMTDLVILNTCHIAKRLPKRSIRNWAAARRQDEAARNGRIMNIAVAGCVAQAEGDEIIRARRSSTSWSAAELSPLRNCWRTRSVTAGAGD